MKVLFLSSFYEYRFGGAELVVRRLRHELQSRGHQIDVLCFDAGPDPQPGTVWRVAPPDILRERPQFLKRAILFLNNRLFDRWMLRRVQSLSLPRYDLVHAHDLHHISLARSLATRSQCPAGLTVQDNVPRQCTHATDNRLLAALLQTCLRYRDKSLRSDLRQLQWITAPSAYIAGCVASFLQPRPPQIFTIHSPYPDFATPASSTIRSAAPRLLFMGRLSREKGIDLLLETLQRYPHPFELTILGLEGPIAQEVRQHAERDSRIRMLKPVPHQEVAQLLDQHDIVSCLSLWNDPLPGTALEARLCGKAILATDKGGIPEILEGYNKAVILNTRAQNRARLIEDCLAGLTEAVRKADLLPDVQQEELFLQRFSPRHFADQFQALYQTGTPQLAPSRPATP